MPKKGEDKHAAFLRLMQARLGRTLEDLRLVRQLSSRAYQYTSAEAEEVIMHLDTALKEVAQAFDIQYRSVIGKQVLDQTQVMQNGPVNVIDVARAIEHIKAGNTNEAMDGLKTALSGAAR